MTLPEMIYDNKAKAIYIKVREGKFHHTRDTSDTHGFNMFTDHSEDDILLGIEILLPQNYNE